MVASAMYLDRIGHPAQRVVLEDEASRTPLAIPRVGVVERVQELRAVDLVLPYVHRHAVWQAEDVQHVRHVALRVESNVTRQPDVVLVVYLSAPVRD